MLCMAVLHAKVGSVGQDNIALLVRAQFCCTTAWGTCSKICETWEPSTAEHGSAVAAVCSMKSLFIRVANVFFPKSTRNSLCFEIINIWRHALLSTGAYSRRGSGYDVDAAGENRRRTTDIADDESASHPSIATTVLPIVIGELGRCLSRGRF